MFSNHYARDTLGTVQKEMESELHVTPFEYGLLNSVFFAPNLIMPVVAGVISHKVGNAISMVGFVAISVVGHSMFAWGVHASSYGFMLAGRSVLGLCYEAIDMLPLPFMVPIFYREWAFVSAFLNSLLRLGSVLTFFLSPLIYENFGIKPVLLIASSVGCFAFCLAVPTYWVVTFVNQSMTKKDSMESYGAANNREKSKSSLRREKSINERESAPRAEKSVCQLLGDLSGGFWNFALSGLFMYAAIVPWLLVGSGYLQDIFAISLSAADWLMLMPEVMIVVACPFIGTLVDRGKWSMQKRMVVAAIAALGFPLCFLSIAFFPGVGPVFPIVMLSVAWTWYNTLFWGSCTLVIPRSSLAVGAGLVGGVINVGATILPLILAKVSKQVGISLLAAASGLSIIFTTLASRAQVDADVGDHNVGDRDERITQPLLSDAL